MPEYAAARTGPRQGLPPASTGYEIAQVVKGPEPNDPFSPAAAGPSKANELLQALNILGKNIVPVALEAGKAIVEHRTKKGAEARLVGDALDPNQSNAFIDGYEKMDGQYRGAAFGNAAKGYAKENSHLPPDEFQKGLDALQSEYVGKLIHQGQLDTFLPEAIKGGEHATSIYQEAKNAAIIQERDQKVQDITEAKMKFDLDQTAFEVAGIPLNKGFASVADDPGMRELLMDHIEEFRTVMAPKFRKIHDDSRAAYKTLGMTPAAIATKFVGTVGRMAGNTGVLPIMDYAYQADASGMSPETANPELTDRFAHQARTTGEHISAAMLLREEKAKKAENEKKSGDWLMELSFPGVTTQTAEKIWLDVWNDKSLDANMKEKLANHARDVMLGGGFAPKDFEGVSRPLEHAIATGALTGQAAYSALLAASPQLSQPTYRHLLSMAKEGAEKGSNHAYSASQQEFNAHLSSVTKNVGLTDDLGKMMINLDISSQGLLARVVSNAQAAMFRGRDELVAKYGSLEKIPGSDFKPLHDRVMQLYLPQQESIVNNAKAAAGREPKKEPSSTRKEKSSTVIKGGESSPGPALMGYTDSGRTSGGKRVYISADGKTAVVGD